MRTLFYAGIALLALFEIANVWLIMPLPGSQRMPSVDVAYFLHRWRWAFRLTSLALIAAGLPAAWRASGWRRWGAAALLLLAGGVAYMTNFVMAADRMFLMPARLDMRPASANRVEGERLVVGVAIGGEARAYPIQLIGYHHQVQDTVGGRPILVTYCTVCRTGRVLDPVLDGRAERFRLVGMDHWNAMLEDASTGSWFRQASGQAIVGPRAGTVLPEIPSQQVTLDTWLAMHPRSLVMQPDSALADRYPDDFDFESGASRKALTGTDTTSWGEKAWVVGVEIGGASVAYDWNRLRRERVINHEVGGTPIVLALAPDEKSFFAFARPDAATRFAIRGDSLVAPGRAYAVTGRGAAGTLAPVAASQEFWHSWRTFHPRTRTY
jgi:hypothetical protein